MLVKIQDVHVRGGRRAIDDAKVRELAESIHEIGQINPIIVDAHNNLIAGGHRLATLQLLGYSYAEAIVSRLSGIYAELAEIDDNLVRYELHYIERGEQLARRKGIYQILHPETKRGMRNGQTSKSADPAFFETPPFADDTAFKTGMSSRVIHEEIQIAHGLTPEAKEVVIKMDIPKRDAIRLARMDSKRQNAIVGKIAKGRADTVQAALQLIKREEKV